MWKSVAKRTPDETVRCRRAATGIRSSTIGLLVPGSLDVKSIDRLSRAAGPPWTGPWSGVLYRWVTVFRADTAWRASIKKATMPVPQVRRQQESLLFSFYANALSCFECFYLGSYLVAAFALRVPELGTLIGLVRRRLQRR